MRARYYEPTSGRFISEDPARQGPNWAIYCGNNPVSMTDPTGRFGLGWWELIGLLLIGVCIALLAPELAAAAGIIGALAEIAGTTAFTIGGIEVSFGAAGMVIGGGMVLRGLGQDMQEILSSPGANSAMLKSINSMKQDGGQAAVLGATMEMYYWLAVDMDG
jgi:hypothetical protein